MHEGLVCVSVEDLGEAVRKGGLLCRPKMKGWLFTVAIAVPDAARMWPKQTFVSVLAAMERKTMSLPGGWMVLYIAGRRPSFWVPSEDSP